MDAKKKICAQNWIEQFRFNLGRSSAYQSSTGERFYSIKQACDGGYRFTIVLSRAFLWSATPQRHELWSKRQDMYESPLSR